MDTLSASVLRDRKPQIGIVLGSGLGALADRIEGAEACLTATFPASRSLQRRDTKDDLSLSPLAAKKWCSWTAGSTYTRATRLSRW